MNEYSLKLHDNSLDFNIWLFYSANLLLPNQAPDEATDRREDSCDHRENVETGNSRA